MRFLSVVLILCLVLAVIKKRVEEAINRLTDRNETLQTAIEDLTDEMKASKGTQSVAAYRDAYKYQKKLLIIISV